MPTTGRSGSSTTSIPSDVFSAHPDQELAYKYRALHGSPGKAWHGDVYKLLFAIHDLFPNLSYRTVLGSGNPQTVVIRRPRPDFAPRFGGLEAIARLSYYDFLEAEDALNLVREPAMLAWVAGEPAPARSRPGKAASKAGRGAGRRRKRSQAAEG